MQFARDNPEITVIGMGAGSASNGDSLDGAYEFVQRYGATLPNMTMIYDVSYQTWRHFGVTTQPWGIGFNGRGELIFNTPGRIDLSTVGPALSS